ncbi:MAG: GLUG motif-containing protein [Planctomycetota bacterium]|jgi:hypothetical protein
MRGEPIIKSAVVVLLWGLAVNVSTAKYSGGTGEPNDPYRIATANDLNDIGNHVEDFNKCFVMVKDVNLADYAGTQFHIIGDLNDPFTGVFDGNGHTISNFTFQTDAGRAARPVGIFGVVFEPNAAIDDLGLAGPHIVCPNTWYVGALVALLVDGTVSGCSCTDGRISGHRYVGGLIGTNWEGTIVNCHVSAAVSCEYMIVGALAGGNGGTISSSSSAGSVYGGNMVGGLVGDNGIVQADCLARIEDSYSTADVEAQEYFAGGLVGFNHYGARIQNCYAKGCVDGNEIAGGLVALAYDCNISNCYALGGVDANDWVGGLVGGIRESLVERCYAAGPVSGDANVGALAGRSYDANSIFVKSFFDSDINPDVNGIGNGSDPDVIGKPTWEMQTESTFTDAGWDFVEVWDIGEGQTYPFLRVHSAGDLNHSGLVDWRDLAILAGHWLEEKE